MKVIAITPDRKEDSLGSLVIEGLYDAGLEVIASDPGNNVRDVYSDDEVIEHSKDADYIFVVWGKLKGVRPPKYYLLDKINRPEVTAYIDGSEWTCTGNPDSPTQEKESLIDYSRIRGEPWINEQMYNYCKWYFKRICFPEDIEKGIIPCYLGAWNSYFRNSPDNLVEKEHDIFCSFGHLSSGLREPIYNHCKNLQAVGTNVLIDKKFDFDTYLEMTAKSYIGVSAWGAGNCCRRMWETTSNSICCFIQKPVIVYPHKFIDGESCVYYETIDEFKEKLDYYLKNKDECVRIGKNAYEHVKKYHTGKKRVEYMLDIMKKS